MSDPEDSDQLADAQPQEPAVPEGMRVTRKRRKRKGQSSRQTLYLKKREILREMHTEEDGLSLKAQVERLKKQAKQDEVPMEDKWGSSRHRRRGSKWIIITVLGVVLPVTILVVVVAVTKEPAGVSSTTGGLLLDLDEPVEEISAFDRTSPEAWFHENSVMAFERALGILGKVNEATNPAQLQGVLRDAERVLRDITVLDVADAPDFSIGDPRTLSWEYGSAGRTGFMVITGRRKDFTSFRAYFVKTDEGMKLDWEATHAVSEIPVRKLAEEQPSRNTLLRCWVGKQPYFDTEEGRASTRSWYIITEPDKDEFVWGYVPTGSRLDRELLRALAYGRIIEDRLDETRAIVRVSKAGQGFRENEFEIRELVTTDWVRP